MMLEMTLPGHQGGGLTVPGQEDELGPRSIGQTDINAPSDPFTYPAKLLDLVFLDDLLGGKFLQVETWIAQRLCALFPRR